MLFKSFQLRNLKRALKQDRLAVEPNTYDTIQITSRTLDFSIVSNHKKIHDAVVLKYLDINDLTKIRLVNRRLNNIVQRHHDSFSKTVFESIGLVRLPFSQMDKITIASIRHTSLDSLAIALSPKQLDSALRHIRVTDHLSVENLAFTRLNCHMLQRSIANQLDRLQLIGCRIEIGFEEFARLIGRWKVRDLNMLNCTLDDAQLVDDQFFRINSQIKGFSLEGGAIIRLPCLTNSTLLSWTQAIQRKSLDFPESFSLGLSRPNFTTKGICTLIEQFIKAPPKTNYPTVWNFGTICGSRIAMVDYLSAFPVSLMESDPNELWIISNAHSSLHARVTFESH
ncbi:hypothetical protein QR680_003491 [Steinernema hermaphroditum]|uniref:F-box domain-containing protein n=1 Tax=Steinernema hermaphroditum TaxID=289476 RepID=A0AA39HLX0_9BILA|nr:hypothetical protein QR680_003491 [Steinernema hermaphroditum]